MEFPIPNVSRVRKDDFAAAPDNNGGTGPAVLTTMPTKRLAFVVHGLETGGIQRSVARLVNDLPSQFRCSIVSLTGGGPAVSWVDMGRATIHELRKRPGNDWTIIGKLSDLLRQEEIDIVQSHNWGTLLETTLARRKAATPIHIHAERGTILGQLDSGGLRRWVRSRAMRWALRKTNVVLSNSQAVAAKIEQACGYPAKSIRIIPNGVDPPAIHSESRKQMRQQLGISKHDFVIGSVGRLAPVKGYDLAIQALESLKKQGNERVRLILVGDGPERQHLRELSRSLNVHSKVDFVGHQDNIGDWLSAFDVYVNTSLSEGMSQSLVEAMAMGIPLIATDVGDNRLLVAGDEPCGDILDDATADALANAIAQYLDPHRRSTIGQRALARHRQRFSLQRMLGRFTELYLGLNGTAKP